MEFILLRESGNNILFPFEILLKIRLDLMNRQNVAFKLAFCKGSSYLILGVNLLLNNIIMSLLSLSFGSVGSLSVDS